MKSSEIILSVLIAICLGLVGFQLKWMFDTNAELKVTKLQIEKILENNLQDTIQDKQLSMHWKLHGWSRDEINNLRHQQNLPLVKWPNLD